MKTFFGTRLPIAKVAWLACTRITIIIVSAYGISVTTMLVELAFINICTCLPVARVALVAFTGVRAISVGASAVGMATVHAKLAFVDIYTRLPVPGKA